MAYTYERPSTFEALSAMQAANPGAVFIAGGTDLMVKIRAGVMAPAHVLDITGMHGFSGVEIRGDIIRVGACTTHTELCESATVRECIGILAESAGHVGSPQIRNAGTVGGNVCNASPAGDTIPALLVLDADVDLIGPEGEENMPLQDFLHMPGKTKIKPGQVVRSFSMAPLQDGEGAAFVKLGQRRALAISVVNGAAWLRLHNGTIAAARLAIGSVAVKTLRLHDAEAMLTGQKPTDELFAQAGQMVSDGIKPIDDVRGSAVYRKNVAATLIRRALQGAFARAKGA